MSKRQWKPMLELKLRKADSKSFQDFVGDFLGTLYPEDFIRVRTHGNLGDGGMDGFRQSDGTLYQCYGARNGNVERIANVCEKLREDFETARLSTPDMKRWLFTHNLIDVPRPLVDAYEEVRSIGLSHGIEVGMLGFDGFRVLLPAFSEEDLEDLIGTRVYSSVDTDRLPETVNLIVKRLIEEMDVDPPRDRRDDGPPVEKFDYNHIPARWEKNLTAMLPYTPIVEEIIASFPDGRTALTVPDFMRYRYQALKAQGLDAGATLIFLHEELAGYVNEHDGRFEAAMAVLACMFESCVIFEDKETTVELETAP